MKITDIHPYLLYSLLLAIYLPGLVAIVRFPRLAALPVVTFTFLGMFLFTAAGSVWIMTRPHFALGSLLSSNYILMLVLQALIFYAVAGSYVYLKRLPDGKPFPILREDGIVRAFLLLATVLIMAIYHGKVGGFLLFDLLAGRINRVNILEFRTLSYGLPEYPFFRLGFLVFPALAAALSVGIASARGRVRITDILCIAFCLIPPLLLAEKAALLHIGTVIFAAYGLHLSTQGRSLGFAFRGKAVVVIAVAFVPTLATYLVYFNTAGDSFREIADQFLFRIFGVYSESLAATVPFVDAHGYLSGTTMPNLKGLLPHERFNLEAAMHEFLAPGAHLLTNGRLSGSSPVPATGEGFVNFGWIGFFIFSVASFACVVLLQEILLRLRMGATTLALSAWYGYLGFTLFTTSLFATFVSLTHTAVAVGVAAIWYAAQTWLRLRPAQH